jgi:N-ethylmaleimide reductase
MRGPFQPYELGDTLLKNRIAMAAMTRSRAHEPGGTATELMATYNSQRVSAGLIITEGVQPSVIGQGYTSTPGLHSRSRYRHGDRSQTLCIARAA